MYVDKISHQRVCGPESDEFFHASSTPSTVMHAFNASQTILVYWLRDRGSDFKVLLSSKIYSRFYIFSNGWVIHVNNDEDNDDHYNDGGSSNSNSSSSSSGTGKFIDNFRRWNEALRNNKSWWALVSRERHSWSIPSGLDDLCGLLRATPQRKRNPPD